MKVSMEKHVKKVDKLLESKKKVEWHDIMCEHMDKINFYQHERLIHLLVTMLFGVLTLILFLYALNNISVGIFILLILLIALLVPYIFHYYFLENSVQKMYQQYDKIKKNMK